MAKRAYKKKTREEWKEQKEALKKVFQEEQDGIVYEAKNLMRFLKFASGFTKYSYRNQLLIFAQCPNAELVATYNGWKKRNRYVRVNEKHIEIFKPSSFKKEKPVLDDNGNQVLDANGNPEKEIVEYTDFSIEYVFDISQTEGEPVPELSAVDEDPMYETNEDLYEALKAVCKTVRSDMDQEELLLAASSEYLEKPVFRQEETEACAYVLAGYMQLSADPLHADRIIDWAKGKKSEEISGFMTRTMKAAGKLLRELEVE